MRTALKEIGEGNTIRFIGTYERIGAGKNLLVTNIKKFNTNSYLCQHAWIHKNGTCQSRQDELAIMNRLKNDILIADGQIYKYSKVNKVMDFDEEARVTDYSLYNIHNITLIRPVYYKKEENSRIKDNLDEYDIYGSIENYKYYLIYANNQQLYTYWKVRENENELWSGYEIIEDTYTHLKLNFVIDNHICKLIIYKTLQDAINNL